MYNVNHCAQDGDPVLMIDTVRGDCYVVTERLGGKLDRAVICQKLIGDRQTDRRLFWDETAKPKPVILTDIGAGGGWMAARGKTTYGDGFRVEYMMPTDDQLLSPIQLACTVGFKHVSGDVLEKLFKRVSANVRIPSTKGNQIKELLHMYGGFMTDDEKAAVLAKAVPAPKAKGKAKPKDEIDPVLAKMIALQESTLDGDETDSSVDEAMEGHEFGTSLFDNDPTDKRRDRTSKRKRARTSTETDAAPGSSSGPTDLVPGDDVEKPAPDGASDGEKEHEGDSAGESARSQSGPEEGELDTPPGWFLSDEFDKMPLSMFAKPGSAAQAYAAECKKKLAQLDLEKKKLGKSIPAGPDTKMPTPGPFGPNNEYSVVRIHDKLFHIMHDCPGKDLYRTGTLMLKDEIDGPKGSKASMCWIAVCNHSHHQQCSRSYSVSTWPDAMNMAKNWLILGQPLSRANHKRTPRNYVKFLHMTSDPGSGVSSSAAGSAVTTSGVSSSAAGSAATT